MIGINIITIYWRPWERPRTWQIQFDLKLELVFDQILHSMIFKGLNSCSESASSAFTGGLEGGRELCKSKVVGKNLSEAVCCWLDHLKIKVISTTDHLEIKVISTTDHLEIKVISTAASVQRSYPTNTCPTFIAFSIWVYFLYAEAFKPVCGSL